jgi:hypothetical protein
MPEDAPAMDLLTAMRDLGIHDPLPESVDARSRSALAAEIERTTRPRSARWLPRSRPARRIVIVLTALLTTGAAAAAATFVVRSLNPTKIAEQNVRDAPLRLFERNPDVIGATPAAEWKQTVIPSTVRMLGTFTVAGVGPLQYWVADTKQHGICGALRMSNGQWVGLQHRGMETGSFPGCYPTRAQVGAGALIIDGFDFINSSVTGRQGQHWFFIYGAVSTPQTLARVRDTFSGTNASLVRGHYFAIALHPVGNDYGDDVHLEAFDAAGQEIAAQGKPVVGSTSVRCVGRYDVRHERIPGTRRFALMYSCHRFVRYIVR